MAQETMAEALVLRRWFLGEADKRLSLYTRQRGKVYAVARGARRVGSKMGSLTEPLALIRLRLIQGRSRAIVAQPQLLDTFTRLHFDLERLSRAFALCELIDRLVPEEEPNEVLFLFTCTLLKQLELHPEPTLILTWGIWKVIEILGYQPRLQTCVLCERAAQDKVVGVDAAHGGVVCGRCLSQARTAFRLPHEAYRQLSDWARADQLPDGSPHPALLHAARAYLEFFLEGELKAFDFLNQVVHPCP